MDAKQKQKKTPPGESGANLTAQPSLSPKEVTIIAVGARNGTPVATKTDMIFGPFSRMNYPASRIPAFQPQLPLQLMARMRSTRRGRASPEGYLYSAASCT